MDRHSIQAAIAQTLENYQRCGMRWIGDDDDGIPSDWSEALAKLAVEQADHTTSASLVTGLQPPNASLSTKRSDPEIQSKPTVTPNSIQTDSAPLGRPAESIEGWLSAELDDAARHNLFQILDQEIRACRKCTEICPHRRQTVFGEGPIRPTVCFMGEAPGADEDTQGRPFVGRSGQLLSKIIGAMHLKREEVYILNSLKCRPPNNRNPSPDELLNCYPFVESQLETLRPKYIVCLGAIAARSLLKRDTPVGQMRGRFYQYRGAKVLVTYHPSYLLRNEDAKRLVWDDMQILMRELGIPLPTKK